MKSTTRALRSAMRALACGAALATATSAALAYHVGEEITTDQQAVATNTQLLSALKQFENAPPDVRAARLQQMTQLAQQRRERLLALLERNPRLAALRVLPAAVRDRLPAQVRAMVESDVAINGTVQALIGSDAALGRTQQRFEVLDAAGQRFELRVADASERELLALVGKRGTITAVQIERQLLVLDKRTLQLAADGTTTSTATTTAAASNAIQGDQSTLVVMLNFSDRAISCAQPDLQNRLFGTSGATLDQGFRQSSDGLVTFSGQVVGPFNVNYTSTGACDPDGWAAAGAAAAQAAGFSLSAYKRVSYATPPNATCGWSGLATLGGSTLPTRSWVQACGVTGVFSHEIGHNLLLHHASTPTSEYGDGSDPMGAAKLVQSNAANRVMAGWIAGGELQDVSAGGSYALAALESAAATSPRTLRLRKADSNEYYYVSLRQPTGVDTALSTTYQNTLSIHRATGTLPARTYLLANLQPGQTWADSVNGIQVVNQGVAGAAATVGVSFSGATCARLTPSISAAPATQTAPDGATLAYGLTIRNNNSAACPASAFNIAQILPAGFTGSLSATSISLAPGASANLNWNVASPASGADAAYTLTASASETSAVNSAEVHASYVVYTPPAPPPPPPADTTPPVVSFTSPAPGAALTGRNVTLAASASDNSGSVATVEFYVDGKLLASDAGAPYSANWNLRKAGRGAHTLRVRALDAKGNAAEQSISVTVD